LNRDEVAVIHLPAGHLADGPQLVAAHALGRVAFDGLAGDRIRGAQGGVGDRRRINLFELGEPRVLAGVPGCLRLERVVGEAVLAAAGNAVLRDRLGEAIEVRGEKDVGQRAGAGIGPAFARPRRGFRRGRL